MKIRRVLPEPFDVVRDRQKLPVDQWLAAIDEKLRIRDYEIAGYEPVPNVTLAVVRMFTPTERG
jgi:hypothetical protein